MAGGRERGAWCPGCPWVGVCYVCEHLFISAPCLVCVFCTFWPGVVVSTSQLEGRVLAYLLSQGLTL